MSPVDDLHVRRLVSFPRVSGDEPTGTRGAGMVTVFSPRERG